MKFDENFKPLEKFDRDFRNFDQNLFDKKQTKQDDLHRFRFQMKFLQDKLFGVF